MIVIHNLAIKDRYLNSELRYLSNTLIVEYDMQQAGLNIIRKYKLLPDNMIKELTELSKKSTPLEPKYGKHQADIKIGKMQRNNKKLSEGLKEGFRESRDLFLTKNNLSEQEVLSIKKDAIFVTKHVNETKLDEFINFRPKNIYSGYLLLNNIEIYYSDDKTDIKNLGEVDEEKHKDYFISFINRFFKKSENCSKEELLKFLRIFIDRYKGLELKQEFYIPFKTAGKYKYLDGVETDVNYRQDLHELDISYNYMLLIDMVKYII